MALQLFTNNASTTLAAPITTGSTSVSVVSGSGALFPAPTGGQWFIGTIMHIVSGAVTAWEIVKCTARVTDTMTIVRAQEGTSAAAWTAGDTLALLVTAGDMAHMIQPDDLVPYAPILSPVFTGNPRSVTPLTADNSVAIATTAYVRAQAYAPIASPLFTGNPRSVTPSTGDISVAIATTAFVNAQNYDTVTDVVARDAAVLASANSNTSVQVAGVVPSFGFSATAGYINFGVGFKLRWGQFVSSTNPVANIPYTQPFSAGCIPSISWAGINGTQVNACYFGGVTNTNFDFYGGNNNTIRYIAVGY